MTRNKTLVIGLTGGIATGKSTAAAIIKRRGFTVIDADEIAREILEPGKEGYKLVIEEFSNSILTEDGIVDRKRLGDIIFSDAKKREKLDGLLHPVITNEILKNLYEHSSEIVVFIDIPLLFEVITKIEEEGVHFDEIWLVYADRATQLERLYNRNTLSPEDALARVDSQMDIEQKRLLADRIIDNTGTKDELEKAVELQLKALVLFGEN